MVEGEWDMSRTKKKPEPETPKLPPDRYEVKTLADLPLDLPFSLSCRHCDIDPPGSSFTSAVLGGWTNIEVDRRGMSWNFLGCCPDCQEMEA